MVVQQYRFFFFSVQTEYDKALDSCMPGGRYVSFVFSWLFSWLFFFWVANECVWLELGWYVAKEIALHRPYRHSSSNNILCMVVALLHGFVEVHTTVVTAALFVALVCFMFACPWMHLLFSSRRTVRSVGELNVPSQTAYGFMYCVLCAFDHTPYLVTCVSSSRGSTDVPRNCGGTRSCVLAYSTTI